MNFTENKVFVLLITVSIMTNNKEKNDAKEVSEEEEDGEKEEE
jgi:hypothetical protein